MIDADEPQQKNTDVFCVNLVPAENLEGVVD